MVKYKSLKHTYLKNNGLPIQVDEENYSVLKISGAEVALVNGLRRSFVEEITTLAFSPESIKVIVNYTQYFEDILIDRCCFIVLNKTRLNDFLKLTGKSINDFVFYLSDIDNIEEPLKNKTQDIMLVYAKTHMRCRDKTTAENIDLDTIGVMYNTLLLTLQPNEEILISMEITTGIGRQHPRFQAGICMMKYMTLRDMDREENEKSSERIAQLDMERKETNTELMRYIKRGDVSEIGGTVNGERTPEHVILTIESIGKLSSSEIIREGFTALHIKVQSFQDFVDNYDEMIRIDNNVVIVSDNDSRNIHDSHNIKITVKNEDHTLGNLIRAYCLKLLKKRYQKEEAEDQNDFYESLVAYRIPHPLKDEVEIIVKTPESYDSSMILVLSACKEILKALNVNF